MKVYALAIVLTASCLLGCRNTWPSTGAERPMASTLPYVSGAGDLIPFQSRDGYWGYLDGNGRTTIAPLFDTADPFDSESGLAIVGFHDGSAGFINRSGRPAFSRRFSWVAPYSDGVACVMFAGVGEGSPKYGFVDRSGRTVIGPRFSEAAFFSHGLCEVMLNGEACVINREGGVLFRSGRKATTYATHHCGRMRFSVAGKWGFLDQEARIAIPCRFDTAEEFSEGYCLVTEAGRQLVIDTAGVVQEPLSSVLAVPGIWARGGFSDGLLPGGALGEWIFLDTAGRTVLSLRGPRYVHVGNFEGGVASVTFAADGAGDGVASAADATLTGQADAGDLQERATAQAAASRGVEAQAGIGPGGTGADGKGPEAVGQPPSGFGPNPATGARVVREGLIDKTGAWVCPPRYVEIRRAGELGYLVAEQGRWGILDRSFQLVLPPCIPSVPTWGRQAVVGRFGEHQFFIRVRGDRLNWGRLP